MITLFEGGIADRDGHWMYRKSLHHRLLACVCTDFASPRGEEAESASAVRELEESLLPQLASFQRTVERFVRVKECVCA